MVLNVHSVNFPILRNDLEITNCSYGPCNWRKALPDPNYRTKSDIVSLSLNNTETAMNTPTGFHIEREHAGVSLFKGILKYRNATVASFMYDFETMSECPIMLTEINEQALNDAPVLNMLHLTHLITQILIDNTTQEVSDPDDYPELMRSHTERRLQSELPVQKTLR